MLSNKKGFTLIELIMVIVIMGILSGIIVPKYFDLQVKAHEAVEEATIGTIKAGLHTFRANGLVHGNRSKYPADTSATFLTDILDEAPANWTWVKSPSSGSTTQGVLTYIDATPNAIYLYDCLGGANDAYTLVKQ